MEYQSIVSKYKLLLVLVAGLIVGLIFILFTPKAPTPPPTPTSTISYQNLQPGISQVENLNQTLGGPLKETSKPPYIIQEFKSSYQNLRHQAITKDDVLQLFIEQVPSKQKPKLTQYTNQYGEAPIKRYLADFGENYTLHLYLLRGFALLVHNYTTEINQVWYFQPTDLDGLNAISPKPLLSTPPHPDSE